MSETVTQTVPVSHEELWVQRQPFTDTNREQIRGGVELSEEEHEVILHAENPVVGTETVPVERVRLATDTAAADTPPRR